MVQESSLRSKPGLGALPRSGSVSYQFQRIPESVEIRHLPPACCVIYWRRVLGEGPLSERSDLGGFGPGVPERRRWEREVGAITKLQPGEAELPPGLIPRIRKGKSARTLPEICVGLGAFRKKKKKACTKEAFARRATHGMCPKRASRSGVVPGGALPASPAHPVGVLGWKEAVLGAVTRPDLGCSPELFLRGLP